MIAFFTSAPPAYHIGLSFAEKRFPIGVGILLSLLRRNGYQFDFYDRYLTRQSFPEKNYDTICIYSNTPCFEDTLRIIKHFKGKRIIVGGPHTSVYPETLKGATHIVQGEGERALLAILNGKEEQRIVKYPRMHDLDTLPIPAYDIFAKMPYCTTVKWFPDAPVFNYSSSRGCPYRCTFCDTKLIWGRQYTCYSPQRVVDDLTYLVHQYGVKGIYFREDNFTCDKERVRKICQLIIKRGLNIKWICETRVNTINEDTTRLMSEAGCCVWYVGFESGSQRMLDIYKKGTTVEQGYTAVYWALKYKIDISGSFIFDGPGETADDKKATDRFIQKCKLRYTWKNKHRRSFDAYVKEVMNG